MKNQLTSAIAAGLKYLVGLVAALFVANNLLDQAAADQLSAEALAGVTVVAGFLAAVLTAVAQHFLRRWRTDGGSGRSGGNSPLPLIVCGLLCLGCGGGLTSCGVPTRISLTDGAGNGVDYDTQAGIGVRVVVPSK